MDYDDGYSHSLWAAPPGRAAHGYVHDLVHDDDQYDLALGYPGCWRSLETAEPVGHDFHHRRCLPGHPRR